MLLCLQAVDAWGKIDVLVNNAGCPEFELVQLPDLVSILYSFKEFIQLQV